MKKCSLFIALFATGDSTTNETMEDKKKKAGDKGTRETPYKVGEAANIILTGATSGIKDIDLTLSEIITGEEAYEKVLESSEDNAKPEAGKEYVLATIDVDVNEIESGNFLISFIEFSLYNNSGVLEKFNDLDFQLDDRLSLTVIDGAEASGLIAKIADIGAENLMLVYDHGRDGETWFSLDE